MKKQLRVPDYLDHILLAVGRINAYTEDMDEVGFLHNQMVQDAVIRNIEVIGEAARNIQKHHPEFVGLHPDVPWEYMYLMRNRVSHGYFSVDLEVVWKTVELDIPELEEQIRQIRDTLESTSDDTGSCLKP
jgi:uncharacterized protein with HEPN domain